MKRQDVSGVERLAVDSIGGGGASDVNLTGINGTAPSTGLGVADGGTIRVAISSDSPSAGNPAAGATGAAVPADADYQGINVAGTLRGTTGVNPSGSIFAQQVDLASIAGTTTATGNGTVNAGVQRVAIASDNTAFSVNATLAAGTALIGKVVASNETSTIYSGTTALTPKFAAISASSNGNNTVIAAGTNKIRVLGWNLMSSGTVNVKWQSGAGGTDLTGLYYLIANTGISVAYNPLGWFETASATLLNLNLSGATAVGGNICYIDVA